MSSKRFAGFTSPNYTMTPNEFFDVLLRQIDDLCELKVTCLAIRKTFGFHCDRAELSRFYIEVSTGLSTHSAQRGIRLALRRGTLTVAQKATNLTGAIYAIAMSNDLRNLVGGQNLTPRRGKSRAAGGARIAGPSLPPINKPYRHKRIERNGNRGHPSNAPRDGSSRKREPHFQGKFSDMVRAEREKEKSA